MVLAGKEPPDECDGKLAWGSSREDTSAVGAGAGSNARARLPPVSFPLRADRPCPTSTGHTPLEGVVCAHAPIRTHARDPSRRPGRQEPGGHRPRHPPDHGRRRPDHQGRPVGPPPARLPDRPVPRGLVPHRPVRGARRRCWSSSSTASSSPRRSSATSSPATSARPSRPPRGRRCRRRRGRRGRRRPARRTCTTTRTRTTCPSGSARTRARRPRPPSTEERNDDGPVQGDDHRQPRVAIPRCATRRPTAR